MKRIFKKLNKAPAYVAYLTAGDGGMDRTYEAALALIKGGVDILEIGVPFSDPVADGLVIQAAAARALENGTSINDVLNLIKRLRQKTDTPIILFSYYNPIFIANKNNDFFTKAKAAGVDGCLIVDLPLEEADEFNSQCIAAHIDPVMLISPNTPVARVEKINQHSRGMLYYVCRKGTTGVKNTLPKDFKDKLAQIKSVATLPVVAGFGIANCEMASEVVKYADGFVIGSKFVEAVSNGISPEQLSQLAKSFDPRLVR